MSDDLIADYDLSMGQVVRNIHDLPSIQPEHIRINLNETIKVKLTDWGKGIYYKQYNDIPKEDKNGYTEFQLWRFMELYGEYMGVTAPNVIEPIEIVCERRKDGLSEEDRAMLDRMRNKIYECGCRGEDVEFILHKALKRIGRYDLLPPCERESEVKNDSN